MMNYIWAGMLIVSLIAAAFSGNMAETSNAILSGGKNAVEIGISLLGMLCLWGGLMKIAQKSGLTEKIAKLFSPLFRFLFPGMDKNSEAAGAISMNITANLLGLGNAATPLGLRAMHLLQKENPSPLVASNHMVTFVVLNTAALHLVPTTAIMLRMEHGAQNPADILVPAWIASGCAVIVAVTASKIFSKFSKIHAKPIKLSELEQAEPKKSLFRKRR